MKHTSTAQIAALDIGTSSARAARFDVRLRHGPVAQRRYEPCYTVDGGAELDPAVLLAAARYCLRQTPPGFDALRSSLDVIAVSCFWHSLMGTDERGRALTPLYTWADSRCRPDAARLRREFSERAVHARTGCMLRAQYWPAKLLWLRRTRPALFRQVKRWMSAGEWIQWQVTGLEPGCSSAMASGTGLFNPTTLDWDEELLQRCQLKPDSLNRLSDEPVEWRGVRWFPAIGDGAAGNLGSGATAPGVAAINYGTSGAVRVMRRGRKAGAPFGLFAYRVDSSRYLVGGPISNAGNLHAWAQRVLRLSARSTPIAEGAARLQVLPFFVPERAPTWPENLPALIVGLNLATTATDIAGALTTASFYRLAQIAAMLPVHPRRYVVSGGLLGSAGQLQTLAVVLGRPVEACAEPEASLRGATVFALEKLGMKVPPLAQGRVYRPRPAQSRSHARARRQQEALERVLQGLTIGSTESRPPSHA